MALWRATVGIFGNALRHFNNDDGWAMASHVALSSLMALFPFLIFATSLASFLGADAFAETAVHLVFDTWPESIAKPIANEVMNVLTVQRGSLVTVSVLAAAYFASNGIEALRASLNRAYRVTDKRSFMYCRLQSLAFVLIATLGFMAISLLLVALPVATEIAARYSPVLKEQIGELDMWRYIIAVSVLVAALIAVHSFLPAGYRTLSDIAPGIGLTLVAWVVGASAFAAYLKQFSSYVTTYAGLASIMIALVFLYIVAVIFIFGGEINAAIMRYRGLRAKTSV
jgi:membrane protein